MFDWENAIALHAMHWNRASCLGEGEVSWDFWSCCRNLGYILELRRGSPFETGVCSVNRGHLSRYDRPLGKLNEVWKDNTDTSGVESEAKRPL